MKIIILTIAIFISTNLLAARVVLLSSLETPKIWFHKKDWEIEKPLEKIFKKHFKESGYEVVIKEKVTMETLWDELHNPENIALFWVSHAKEQSSISTGISNEAAVVDYYGSDVKEAFKYIHPNMRYVGLIGCNAESIIDSYKEEGFYQGNPFLRIHSFDKKIDARKGLRQSIRKSALSLGDYKNTIGAGGKIFSTPLVVHDFEDNYLCKEQQSVVKVNLLRTTNEDVGSVSIKISNHIVGFLPALEAGGSQRETLLIPSSIISSTRDLKITIDSNVFGEREKLSLGNYELEPVGFSGSWKLFSKMDGTPIGVTKNIYRYKGELPGEESIDRVQIYSCR